MTRPATTKKYSPDVERWRPLVDKYWPANQRDNALAIINWESHGDPGIIGDKTLEFQQDGELYGFSVGLMQIRELPGRPKQAQLQDPEFNIKSGAEIYKTTGSLCPWTGARKLGLVKGCR